MAAAPDILSGGLSSAAVRRRYEQSAKSMGAYRQPIFSFMCFFSASIPVTRRCHCVSYLMTLSALASTLGGIVRPICFAVFKIDHELELVGCSTGRSPAFAPLRILST